MTTAHTVAITGSTGFVGRFLVRELLQRGINVRALARSRDKADAILPRPGEYAGRLTVVIGNALHAADLKDLLSGVDACINLVGIIREVPREGVTFQRMHVDVTRTLVRECEQLGVSRFLQMSALNARPVGVSEYQTTKFEAEQALRQSSLRWTILRPGLIFGKGSVIVELAKGWCTGHSQPYLFLPYFSGGVEDQRVPLGSVRRTEPRVAPVRVEDVCEAFANALVNDAAVGEVYNLVGSETLSWPQMLMHMKENIPGALPGLHPVGIPAEVAAIQAKVAGWMGLGQFLPFDEGMARMGAEDAVADLTKAREDLNIRPRAFRECFAECL
ncbi:MAG: NAD(P)H-binding protein [Phycisphaerales bacterium]